MNTRLAIVICLPLALLARPQDKTSVGIPNSGPSSNTDGYKIKFESESTSTDQGDQNLFEALFLPPTFGDAAQKFANGTGVDLGNVFPKDVNVMKFIDNGMMVLGKLKDDTMKSILKPLQLLKNDKIAIPRTTVYVEILPEKQPKTEN